MEADISIGLYRAKQSGRNRSVLAKPSGLEEIREASRAEDTVEAV
jgi:hypothetical protein